MNDPRLETIARRHGARLMLQFGSTVGGAEHAGSDDLQRFFPGRDGLTLPPSFVARADRVIR